MSEINDGGPAYPSGGIPGATDSRSVQRDGMSMRDYFAGQVLGGLGGISTELAQVAKNRGLLFSDIVAGYCYEIADAMLAARKPKV